MKKLDNNGKHTKIDVKRNDEIGYLMKTFNTMSYNIDYLVNVNYREKLTRKEAQIKALQSQINPHFIFNTLENINWLAQLNGINEISTTVTVLTNIMEASICRGSKLVTLWEELTYVESYIDIFKVRFSDKFSIIRNISEDTLDIKIPKLLIEPIVENAINHGIERVSRQGVLVINSFIKGDDFVIEVNDNGIGMKKEVKDFIRNCKIIILSGYRDFEYMQSAIKLGAFDYILKPSKVNDIVAVVKRAVEKINEEKEKERSICGLEIKGYRVITVRIFNVDNDLKNFRIQGISELFKESFESIGSILCSEVSRDKFVYIVQYDESKDKNIEIEKKLDEFIKQVNEYYSFKIYAGISEYGSGLFELNSRLNESLMDLNLKKSDIGYKDIKEEKKDMKESKVISLSIRKTLDYINEHYNQNITLNDMAEYNGISPYYLSRLFTKETGKNFVDYVNEVRIKKAKELLREDNYKYYEIAEMVGINDSHYFSKIFKKYTGITPSEYKREKC